LLQTIAPRFEEIQGELEYAQTGKSLELLKEIAPKVERVAVIGLIAPLILCRRKFVET
jgi:hypothetical protein